ncbi:MAG: hypothetical protein PHN82_04850 [bacterium]|nr:hypothetical protein [bacterium]
MTGHLREQIRVQIVFFRRNRLIRAVGLFVGIILAVMLIPSVATRSSMTRFDLIRRIQQEIGRFAFVMGVALAVLTFYYHVSTRCIKMVLTKPCRPEGWMLSVFLSTVLACSSMHLLGLVLATILSLVWTIPFQTGIIFVAIEGIASSTVALSWAVLLATFLHPAVAVLIIMVIHERLLYWLMIVTMGAMDGTTDQVRLFMLRMVQQLLAACYVLLPTYSPLADKVKGVHLSYRVLAMDWVSLAGILGYALLFAAFCYVVSTLIFLHRRYI